ncbi:MAG: HIRAN domain-containing protein [bacterium]
MNFIKKLFSNKVEKEEKNYSIFKFYDNTDPNYRSREYIETRKIIRNNVFSVSGYYYLTNKIKNKYNKIKENDQIKLKPEPNNKYDKTAISVWWKNHHIGWIALPALDNKHKDELFNALNNNNKYESFVHNIRKFTKRNGEYWYDFKIRIAYIK